MPTIKTLVSRFDGGLTNNPRDPLSNKAKGLRNFDALTDPFTLIPYRDSENGSSIATTHQPRNFVIARRTGTTYSLYALGVQSGASDAEVFYKDLTTTSTDLSDAGWSTPNNNQQGTGTIPYFDVFTYYQNQDEIYAIALHSGTYYIQAFSPTGSAWIDQEVSLGSDVASVAEGLVHSKDDVCYIPYDNKIASKDGTNAFDTTALTLPAHLKIVCLAEYGNYLAIACAPKSRIGNSYVYLWNRDSSLATLSEMIDFGDGDLKIIETINGQLIGISLLGGDTTRLQDKIVFRRYTGASDAEKLLELAEDTSVSGASTQLLSIKQKTDGRVLFMMQISLHEVDRSGVWSFGKSSPTQPFTLIHESTPNDDASVTSNVLRSFFKVGEYLFQSFVEGGSTFTVTKTNNTSGTYTASSIYESTINPNLDKKYDRDEKVLKEFHCRYNALDSSGSVKAEYRVNGGSWEEIFTETTDNALLTSQNKDVNGKQFKKGIDFEYRLTSTGGAEITEFGAVYETEKQNVGTHT